MKGNCGHSLCLARGQKIATRYSCGKLSIQAASPRQASKGGKPSESSCPCDWKAFHASAQLPSTRPLVWPMSGSRRSLTVARPAVL
eukprot:5377616-Amphidinium_carterae.1